ncbi:hypothetical protein J6590_059624 [Homalodisca vitripennis]|nr:hypothetical protein J6590_059624 [Homalodisca vitripennis]
MFSSWFAPIYRLLYSSFSTHSGSSASRPNEYLPDPQNDAGWWSVTSITPRLARAGTALGGGYAPTCASQVAPPPPRPKVAALTHPRRAEDNSACHLSTFDGFPLCGENKKGCFPGKGSPPILGRTRATVIIVLYASRVFVKTIQPRCVVGFLTEFIKYEATLSISSYWCRPDDEVARLAISMQAVIWTRRYFRCDWHPNPMLLCDLYSQEKRLVPHHNKAV